MQTKSSLTPQLIATLVLLLPTLTLIQLGHSEGVKDGSAIDFSTFTPFLYGIL